MSMSTLDGETHRLLRELIAEVHTIRKELEGLHTALVAANDTADRLSKLERRVRSDLIGGTP